MPITADMIKAPGVSAGGLLTVVDDITGDTDWVSLDSLGVWSLGGNSATSPGIDFLGTTDNTSLEIRVNDRRALRIDPGGFSGAEAANFLMGDSTNSIANGIRGSIVAGGDNNRVLGDYSFASGRFAFANHSGSFVWSGLGNLTGSTMSVAPNSFTVRASGGVRFLTNAVSNVMGVQLAPNATAWTTLSDRNTKKGFAPVSGETILAKLAELDITQWQYIWEGDQATPHIGPMAQDFIHAFYPGRDDRRISTLEADGVHFAAIKALEKRTRDQQEKADTLAKRNADLARENQALKDRLDRLEALVKQLADEKK